MNCKVFVNSYKLSEMEFKIAYHIDPRKATYYERYNLDSNILEEASKYEYYYMHQKMDVEYGLPDNAVVLQSSKENLSLQPNVQGVIFDNLSNLPNNYKEIVEYWNPKLSYEAESMSRENRALDHAIFYYINELALKSPKSKYRSVDHYATSQDPDNMPKLLTDGYVFTISNLSKLIPSKYHPNTFVQVNIPIDDMKQEEEF